MTELHPFSISLKGQHLVEASAGTGKTYNITSLFIRSILEKETAVDEILVLTYTKAATAELKERIMSRLRDSVQVLSRGEAPEGDEFLVQLLDYIEKRDKAVKLLEKALHNFDEASIFTIHSFCQRALQEQSFLSGITFDTELVADDTELVQEVVDDWWRNLVEESESTLHQRIWLNILREEGYLPDKLATIVAAGLGKPYLKLSVDVTAEATRPEELEELKQLFEKLKDNWVGNQGDIQKLLLSDAMDGRKYQSRYLDPWMEAITEWLEKELPSLAFPDKLDRFSIDYIREYGTKKGESPPQHPFFYCVKAFIEQADRVRSWIPEFKKEMINYGRSGVRERKQSAGVMGYDDLLVLLQEALNRVPTGTTLASFLREKFPVALVDEFQDTDPIQYNILETIYPADSPDTALFLVGDPKQSIYSFRGADVFSYLNARNGVPENQQYSLDRNFRSDPDLIGAVNALFDQESPFWVDDISFAPVQAADIEVKPFIQEGKKPPLLQFSESEHVNPGEQVNKGEARERAAGVTAESISRLLNRGQSGGATIGENPVRPKDIAILVRTHRQADLIREKLEQRSIKCVQYSEKSVFETGEARNIELLLKAVAEPRNDELVRTVLATGLFEYDAHDLLRFKEDEQAWTENVSRFSEWNRIWLERGFSSMFRSFLLDAEVEQHLVGLEQGERKLTNTLQLGELLQAREQEHQEGMFELVKWLSRKRREPDNRIEEEQLRLESDEELVRIVTMHRSKGLEYPIVYCPFLWDGAHFSDKGDPFLYHDSEDRHQAAIDLNEKGNPARRRHRLEAAREELSESLRLAYVALTRAKQHCRIVYESASGIEFSPLGYLLLGKEEIDQQLVAKIGTAENSSSLPPEKLRKALESLLAEHSNLFAREVINDQSYTEFRAAESDDKSRSCRQLTAAKAVQSRSIVSSFSSIMHPSSDRGDEDPDDEFFLPEERGITDDDPERTIFTFPKGPQAGTCVHTIFEDLRFAGGEDLDEVIAYNLDQFGFEPEWLPVVKRMVQTVLQKPLKEGLSLNRLEEKKLLKEMEFYFDLRSFLRDALVNIIRGRRAGPATVINEGFMKGYIDLVFAFDGQFFIADYKTNYLGDALRDYTPGILREEMNLAGYDVQYHIYAVALHRYLEQRVPNYAYETHFGGVFYLFVRGMTGGADRNGIFYDKPDLQKIRQLDQLFRMEAGK
ncbi:exodeoxyribonuclease V subunit beta [Halalkalibaculum sp. DA384]|uniref:exodeoxyribonuclease V subunit beta n=1 Tax=Halalkalibaculum sp. DA384 TaxID=3373606 RepID=UPI00375408C7